MKPPVFTCDACPRHRQATYYDLVRDGWTRYTQGKGRILLCPDCTAYYTAIWTARERLTA